MPLHLRLATEADTDGIARVATAAFDPSTDAIARNLFPAHLQKSAAAGPNQVDAAALNWRRTRKGIKARTERVVLMVVTDDALAEEDAIVGFSLWEEPVAADYVADPNKKPEPLIPCETLDEEAYKTLRQVTADATKDYFGEGGYKHMWYLDYLGVHPDHQRRGIGKMLLNWGLDTAKAQNKDAFLIATPAGVPLYQVMGFEGLDPFMLFDTPHTGMIKRLAEQ